MRWLVLALCLGLSLSAQAGEVWLHGLSHHTDGGDYNEVNEGLGIELPVSDRWSVEIGQYQNSFKRPTRYLLGHYRIAEHGQWRLGAALGVADNYDDHKFDDGRGVPIGGLTVKYWRLRVMLIPDKSLDGIEVAALSARILDW